MFIIIRFDLYVYYDYIKYRYNIWFCNFGEYMIMFVFFDFEVVFIYIIVGIFLVFVFGVYNRE